jgi:hypothetical protein
MTPDSAYSCAFSCRMQQHTVIGAVVHVRLLPVVSEHAFMRNENV